MTRNDRRPNARRFASPKFVREGNRAYTSFFTGKPHVAGLGHAFLMRNYRAGLAKWQTADPMGYPDGWNQLAYCNNDVTSAVDLWGCAQRDLGEIVVGDKKPIREEKDGDQYWGNIELYKDGCLVEEYHLLQDWKYVDDTLYAHKYRNTKSVPAHDWLHSLVDGFNDVGDAALLVAAAMALLPDPIPPTKAGEITSAAAIGAGGAISKFIGKILGYFDDMIEVWDGAEYMGTTYKHIINITSTSIIE